MKFAQISLLIAATVAFVMAAGCDSQSAATSAKGQGSPAAAAAPCCPGTAHDAADASPLDAATDALAAPAAVAVDEAPPAADQTPVTETEEVPAESTGNQPKENNVTEQPKAGQNPRIKMETTMGSITIELYPDKAPITVANFLAYVDSGFFADTIFHRVIPDFMLQGGGFTKDMNQKATLPTIKNEAKNGLKNERGTLSMARTAAVDSATSQFFINLKHNDFLDHGTRDFGYAVFAKVVDGMDVVDAIGKVQTRNLGHHSDVPAQPVIIKSVTRVAAE